MLRCSIAFAVLSIAFFSPAAGRLLGITKVSPEDATEAFSKGSAEVASKIPRHIVPEVPQKTMNATKVVGCSADCNCHDGEPENGGSSLVSGTCLSFCSRAFDGLRYCGHSVKYSGGDSIDCRQCSEPDYFGAEYKMYKPKGKADGSLILLGPWNASLGWGSEWIIDNASKLEPSVRTRYRILDVHGRKMPRTDFRSWYNYDGGDAAWHKDIPIMQDVDLAVSYVHHLIEQEYKIVGDYGRVVLFGLSQGASLALESALRFPHKLGLVFSQRGALFDSRRENSTAVAPTPYILTVGSKDHYYAVDKLKSDSRHLKTEQASVFMKTIPGLDHYKWSKPECKLSLQAIAAALARDPPLSKLTDWTVSS